MRTLEVSDPKARIKRNLFWVIIVGSFVAITIMILFEIWLGAFSVEMIALIALVLYTMEVLIDLFLLSTKGRSLKPVKIYSGGIEFPKFAFDRLLGKKTFVPKTDIAEASVGGLYGSTLSSGFTVRTLQNKKHYSGERADQDVRSALEFMRKEWGIKLVGMPESTARKIGFETMDDQPYTPSFCPGCGARMNPDYEFCPQCGHLRA